MTLQEWMEKKRDEIRRAAPVALRDVSPSIKDFHHAVTTQRGALAVVAEIARATPEEGPLSELTNFSSLVPALDAASVSAIAVATDFVCCQGAERDLETVAQATSSPVLARDLFLTREQLYAARLRGADAVLLTAAAVTAPELRTLIEIASSMHMAAPVEVASRVELSAAESAGARIFVIPAFSNGKLSLSEADGLLPRIPRSATALVRGPFASASDFQSLRARADGIWIAGPLMRAKDPTAYLQPLVNAAENG